MFSRLDNIEQRLDCALASSSLENLPIRRSVCFLLGDTLSMTLASIVEVADIWEKRRLSNSRALASKSRCSSSCKGQFICFAKLSVEALVGLLRLFSSLWRRLSDLVSSTKSPEAFEGPFTDLAKICGRSTERVLTSTAGLSVFCGVADSKSSAPQAPSKVTKSPLLGDAFGVSSGGISEPFPSSKPKPSPRSLSLVCAVCLSHFCRDGCIEGDGGWSLSSSDDIFSRAVLKDSVRVPTDWAGGFEIWA